MWTKKISNDKKEKKYNERNWIFFIVIQNLNLNPRNNDLGIIFAPFVLTRSYGFY